MAVAQVSILALSNSRNNPGESKAPGGETFNVWMGEDF
jgi:hypothetical protein